MRDASWLLPRGRNRARIGADGVEFHYASEGVFDLLDFARARGLGTNVWTFDAADGTELRREFREAADAVTTNSPLDLCRQAIEER